MMKIILLTVCFCRVCNISAQNNQQKTDSVCWLINQYVNAKDADRIYSLAGEGFRKAITFGQFKQFTDNNLFPLGPMQTQYEYSKNGVSKYKASFAKNTLALLISLDEKEKLSAISFKEYIDESKAKTLVLTTNQLQSSLDKYVDSVARPYASLEVNCGLSIGIIKDGKVFFYGYGETAKGNKQVPDKYTLFEIGSVTKTFTAILLADAINNGKIKADDPVNKYLPDSIGRLQYGGVPVTIKMLSNHSSGIPRMPSDFDSLPSDPRNPYKDYDENRLFSFYRNLQLTRKPGTVYEYSNMAVATLGLILQHVYNKNYEQLITEKICQPLGMTSTRQFLHSDDSSHFAKGYNEQGKYNGPWDFKAFAPAGSIRSNASDMLLYAKANMDPAPAVLAKDIELTHAVTFTDGRIRVGLGWHLVSPGSDEILFHNGGTGGYRSFLGINSRKKFAVVILSNSANSTDQLGNYLMKRMEKD